MWAQNEEERNQIIEQRVEFIGESLENSDIDLTTYLEELYYYFDHPLSLNQASFEEFIKLRLLTDAQIMSIINYRKQYGDFLSVYELQAVDNLDELTIEMILPFMTTENQVEEKLSIKELLKYGESDYFIRYERVLEQKEGYIPKSDSVLAENPNKMYLGSPDKIYSRYRFQYQKQFSLGVTMEKDPGEAFFTETQKQGFDFYSAHLFYQPNRLVKTVVVGDFQARYGQGLTLWSGFNLSKTANVLGVRRVASGLKPYTSANETNFLRGAGISLQYKPFEMTFFTSYKSMDANIQVEDTLFGEGSGITSFQTTGYHRTWSELENKNTIKQSVVGSAIEYTNAQLKIGLVGVYTHLSQPFMSSTQTYNSLDFNGTHTATAGLNYLYFHHKISLFGETSLNQDGSISTLNGLQWHLDPRLDVLLLYRYFNISKQSLYSASFGSSSTNEKGLYMGVKAKLNKWLNVSAYYDQYAHDWLKWLTDGPSHGNDVLVQFDAKINRKINMYFRYKYKWSERNSKEDVDGISPQVNIIKTNYRLHLSYQLSSQISLKSRIEHVHFLFDTDASNGLLLYQDVSYEFKKTPIKLTFRYAIFDTDNYDTRIYAYENDLLYVFSIPSYYYQGIRFYSLIKYKFRKNLQFWVKYGVYSYANVSEISSGLEQIDGHRKSEVKCQLRIKF